MAIEWSEKLATGIEMIDNQHRELFKRFDALLAACSQGKGKEEVKNLLLFVEEYIRTHFTAEEELQLRHRYPGYASHKAQHEAFVRDYHKLADEFQGEGVSLALVIQTNQVLLDWLLRHISKTDRELADYLNSGSAQPRP